LSGFGNRAQAFGESDSTSVPGLLPTRVHLYDPNVLARLGVVGVSAEAEKARSWYQKAETLGSPDARRRLDLLAKH
jgi:TPR repeat protein